MRRSFHFKDPEVGALEFQSSVSSDTADGNPDDNTATQRIDVEPRADLRLGLDIGETKGAARNATLAASIRNTSKGPARGARLQIEIERGLGVVSLPAGCVLSPQRVTCDIGTMADRSSATRVIGVRAARNSTYSLVGVVTWDGRDPTPADNQAQALLTTMANTRIVALSRLVRGLPSSGGCVRGRKLRAAASHAARLEALQSRPVRRRQARATRAGEGAAQAGHAAQAAAQAVHAAGAVDDARWSAAGRPRAARGLQRTRPLDVRTGPQRGGRGDGS